MARASGFKTDEARTTYCRLYDAAVALSPVPVDQTDVEGRFGVTHVLTAGDPAKPPLVALHGKAMSSTMWLPLLPTLASSHRVHLVDALGDVNKSVARAVLSSPDLVVEWIDETLGALDVERAAMVGASLGAWMAARYTMVHPSRVERLALIGPAGLVSGQHARWTAGALYKVGIRPTPARVTAFLDSMAIPSTVPKLREDPWLLVAGQFALGISAYRTNFREPRPVRCDIGPLAASGVPVLVAVGRQETLHDGPLMARRFRERLPDARIELVDDANHALFIDQPEVVEGLLRDFLQPRA
jgi:pimeloyl-ACP methyl ester carboxylesterase